MERIPGDAVGKLLGWWSRRCSLIPPWMRPPTVSTTRTDPPVGRARLSGLGAGRIRQGQAGWGWRGPARLSAPGTGSCAARAPAACSGLLVVWGCEGVGDALV